MAASGPMSRLPGLTTMSIKWKIAIVAAVLIFVVRLMIPNSTDVSSLIGYDQLKAKAQASWLSHLNSTSSPSSSKSEGKTTFVNGHMPANMCNLNDTAPNADREEYAAICVAIKNQGLDLPEWLAHHYHHLGIRRFYIMDDGSVPALGNTEDYGIPRESLTFHYFAEAERMHNKYMQQYIYNYCNARWGKRHVWIAYIDADEFLEITQRPAPGRGNLADFLRQYEDVGALTVNWQTHDSNGHLTRQPSVRKAYTSCVWDDPENNGENTDNKDVKTIAQTKYFLESTGPHTVNLVDGMIPQGENRDIVGSPFRQPITRDKIALHHYGVKSLEEYEEKMGRGNPTDDPKDMGWWDHIVQVPKVECPSMAQYDP